MREIEILERLDGVVWEALSRGALDLAIRRVTSLLARDGAACLAWESVPLSVYPSLPAPIRSSWIFVLRGGTTTGAERHPNSIQRVMAYRGHADMETWTDEGWKANALSGAIGTALDRRWLTIPASVWHRPVIPPGPDWLVISFHTAAAEELIEERPENDDTPDSGPVGAELYAGRRAR